MKLLIRAAVLSLLLVPAVVAAQEPNPLAGSWQGSLDDAGTAVPMVIDLRIQGDVVTGPIIMRFTEQYMRNGSVAGATVAFTSRRLSESDRDVPMVWRGELVNDQLTFTIAAEDGDGPARQITLTRQTAQ